MSTANLSTNSALTQSYTAANNGMDGAQQSEGETLFEQASQSHQPEVLVKRQFEQCSQSQKSKLADEFIASAGREGLSQLAATPDGQHALVVVYDHAGSDGRGTMRQVHEEQGNTAVDYTDSQNNNLGNQSEDPLSVSDSIKSGGVEEELIGVPKMQMKGIFAPRQESTPGWGTPRDLYDVTLGLSPLGGVAAGIYDAYQDYHNGSFSADSTVNIITELLPGPDILKKLPGRGGDVAKASGRSVDVPDSGARDTVNPNYIGTSNGDIANISNLAKNKRKSVERELRVAEITGGKSAVISRIREKDGKLIVEDTPIIRDGRVVSGVDVFGKNGELIQVGGPGKNANDVVFEKTKRSLEALKDEAKLQGTKAQVYYEQGHSDRFKELVTESQRILGQENVFILPD